jgi:Family of unknown function (DUF5926)/SEC-C motif
MGKRSRVKTRTEQATGAPGEVGPRQPCPCGSGRRYKACHGSASGAAPAYVPRPFEGLRSECDLVALRELVPAATAPVALADSGGSDRQVVLCSLLPMAAPALVRQDGTVWLGLQVQHSFGDPSRDLAAALQLALDAEPGEMVGLTEAPGEGPRLQELLADEPLQVTVHDGFDFWISDLDDPDGALGASLEQANAAATPTARLTSAEAAYWTDVGTKEHLRWVLPHDEDVALDALARLHAGGRDSLVEGSRLVGMFRAHGLLVPVWDLPVGTGPEALEEPLAELASALGSALSETAPLTSEERSARSGLANRQVTIR